MSPLKRARKPAPLVVAIPPWPRVWNGGPAEPVGEPALNVLVHVAVASEANARGFWAASSRKKKQLAALEEVLSVALVEQPIPSLGPWCVRLTRYGRGRLDDDNLARAFKGSRDFVARVLGVDDGAPEVAWAYAQQRRIDPGMRVEVWAHWSLPIRLHGTDPASKRRPCGCRGTR